MYGHLRGCYIGDHQGVLRGLGKVEVPKAISHVKALLGLFPSYQVFDYVIATMILLADFLYHKIDFPASKARRVRAIKNKLNKSFGRRSGSNTEWVKKRLSHIKDLLEFLKSPLKQASRDIPLGPFTLKNPIHLSEHKVERMETAISDALKLCTNSLVPSFKSCLYGDVALTEKIGRASWFAWYNKTRDDITIKYFERDLNHFIRTFIHEMGHRYYLKVLPASKKALWAKYHTMAVVTNVNLRDWVGDPSVAFYVKLGRGGGATLYPAQEPGAMRAMMTRVDHEGVYFTTEGGRGVGPFRQRFVMNAMRSKIGLLPSTYASTSAEEHFCEALAYKALGDLKRPALRAFDAIFIEGVECLPTSSDFTEAETPLVVYPEKSEEPDEVSSKSEQVSLCYALARELGLSFNEGRKYGRFVYENMETSSTHAYMFIDYSTGNFFMPKTKSTPNMKVNIGNVEDDDLEVKVSFKRMDKLRPNWRTQATISRGI